MADTAQVPTPQHRTLFGIEDKWLVAIVFALAMFIDILDSTIVNVSLPDIAKELHGTFSTSTWISLGYVLCLAVSIPASGWVGAKIGTKKTFLFALAMFTGASALCGQAGSMRQLVAFRVLQGIGGGMLTPVGTTMLFRAFPPAERARASAVLAIPTVLAPATGPVLGGYLTEKVSWRWIFYVNLPVGVIAFVFGLLYLREHREDPGRSFDIPGFVLVAAGFPALIYALERGPENGWGSPSILTAAAVAVIGLALLVRIELRKTAPLLDLRLLGERLFRTSNIISILFTGCFFGTLFLLPQFLQRVKGLSPLESGLATFPQAIAVILMSRITGKIYLRVGPRRQLSVGLAGLAATSFVFALIDTSWSPWWIRLIMFVRGLFLGNCFIPLQTMSYARISFQDTGRASAIQSTTRQLASAIGVAVLSTILLSAIPGEFPRGPMPPAAAHGFTVAFRWSFFAAALFAVVGSFAAQLVRDEDVANTIKRP